MKNCIRFGINLLILCLIGTAAFADNIPLRLQVDGVNLGDIPAVLNEKGKPTSVDANVLVNILKPFIQSDKIQRIISLKEPSSDYITLDNVNRVGLATNYVENDLMLVLTIPLEMRSIKDYPVVFAQTRAGLGLENKNFSGYLNLRGTVSYSAQINPLVNYSNKNPGEGTVELVQNLGIATLETTAHYLEYDPHPFERVDTSLVHDFEEDQVRLRLGDFNTRIEGFQTAMPVAGIQIEKQFNINSDRNPFNKRSTLIEVKNNSLLEVFVNDILISRVRVTPGPYNLKNLPLIYGSNTIKVILTDDLGKKEEFLVDMLFDDQFLPKGMSDFAYQAGRPSYFLGNEKKYYDDSFSSIFHKYGVTDAVTVELNHQNYLSTNLWGVGAGFLSPLGSNFFDVAHYTDDDVHGANGFKWRFNSAETNLPNFLRFRIFLGAEFRSEKFLTISPTVFTQPNFAEKYDAVLQKQITERSSFSLGYTKLIGQHFGTNDQSYRAIYQNQFLRNWRVDVAYSRAEQTPNSDQLQLSLNWLESDGKAQATLSQDIPNKLTSIRYDKNSRFNYNDIQLSMYGQRQEDRVTGVESQSMDLYANYYAPKYEISGQANTATNGTDLSNSERLGLGTAIAWTSDSINISRPISDSFAVIQAEGLGPRQTLTIPNGLEEDRITVGSGESFVYANLASYVDRPLKLDSTGLGASSHLDRESYILRPTYRSGIFVPLKVVRSLTLKGKLESAKPDQVSYIYGRILDSQGKVFSNNFFTDESGNFIVDGLSYGKYQIELADPRLKKINFELVDTGEKDRANQAGEKEDSDASVFQLGTIKIETEAGR
jgi:outer membrane usher protein